MVLQYNLRCASLWSSRQYTVQYSEKLGEEQFPFSLLKWRSSELVAYKIRGKCLYLHRHHIILEVSSNELFLKWYSSGSYFVNPLQNHYQCQSKSIQIKLKVISVCGSEMSIVIPSTGLLVCFLLYCFSLH